MIVNYLVSYLITLVVMLVFDAIWLSSMIDRLYKKNIDHIMATDLVLPAALVFYLLYGFGVTMFVTMPGIQQQRSLWEIFLYGALFGLVAYGTYDLTNHATLRDWPLTITVIDMLWGALMTAMASLLSVYIFKLVR